MRSEISWLTSMDPLADLQQRGVDVNELPDIKALREQFKRMLPEQFGEPRAYMSPFQQTQSALRADCVAPKCGTRAVIHIARDANQILGFVEDMPIIDRTDHANCPACLQMESQRIQALQEESLSS